jgi:hypothetical protein
MSAPSAKTGPAKSNWHESLHRHPNRFRAILTLSLVAFWYFACYQPIVGQIDETRQQYEIERKRLALAEQIEELRKQTQSFADRLPKVVDQNAALQYLIDGVRALPLKLINLEPKMPKDVGPYKSVVADLTVEGNYADAERLLRWVEGNPKRLYRVDAIRLDPSKPMPGQPRRYKMQILIVGVTA